KVFVNGGGLFDVSSGNFLGPFGKQPVLGEDFAVAFSNGRCRAFDPQKSKVETTETKDTKGNVSKRSRWTMADLGGFDAPRLEAMIRAGSRLYLGSPGHLAAVDLPIPKGKPPVFSWKADIEGTPASMVAADDRLFAVTLEGKLYCFGTQELDAKTYIPEQVTEARADEWTGRARTILETTGV